MHRQYKPTGFLFILFIMAYNRVAKMKHLKNTAKRLKKEVDKLVTAVGDKFTNLLPSHYGMNDAEYPEWYIKQMNEKKQGNNEK